MFQFCHLFLNLDFLITLLEYLYSMPVLSVLQSSDLKLIDVFFIVDTWLKDVGDEAKIADLTPSGYATRSFPWANRGGGLAIIVQSHILQNIAFKSSFGFDHNSFELFQVTLSLEKGLSTFSVCTDLHLIAKINLPILCWLNNCLHSWNTAIPFQVVC